MVKMQNVDGSMRASKIVCGNIYNNLTSLIMNYVVWDSSIWLPKCGKVVEAIDVLSLTAMTIAYWIPNDNMWNWRVTFGIIFHSSWATLRGIMIIIDGGVRTILEATIGCATAAMIGKDLRIVLADVTTFDVHYFDTPIGDSLVIAMAI